MPPRLDILECTLRDGSYPIDYQFTAEDTAVIAAGLERAGFRWIEIGHGLGLGASRPDLGMAAATDEEYLAAAAGVLTTARFGAFFIPGIGDASHLALAVKHGAGFIRIGADVTETERAEPFIKRAKDLGLHVSANPMKSYAVPLEEFVRRAVQLAEWGADVISIVDSAGGMLPAEVAACTRRLRENVGAAIGFHGHNNLQLAIANVLAAIEAGAAFVDTSLRGLGRSSGNAQTEVLVMLLEKLGLNPGIHIGRTLDLGDRVIAPMARGRGVDSIEVTTGFAQFHSGFLKPLLAVAQRTGIEPRELIVKVSECEKVKVTEAMIERIAGEMAAAQEGCAPAPHAAVPVPARAGGEATDVAARAAEIAREIRGLAAKTGKTAVFAIAAAPQPRSGVAAFPFVRSDAACVVGNAEVCSTAEAVAIAAAVDGVVDAIVVEADARSGECAALAARVAETVRHSRCLTYRDADALVQAADALLAQFAPDLGGAQAGISGGGELSWKLAIKLAQRGARVVLFGADSAAGHINALLGRDAVRSVHSAEEVARGSAVLVGAATRTPVIDCAMIDALPKAAVVLDAGVGTVAPDAVQRAAQRGIRVCRLDMRPGLTAEIACVLETAGLIANTMGRGEMAAVPTVAGGLLGQRGDVVVDAIAAPSRVIGVADGRGGLLAGEAAAEFVMRVRAVRQAIVAKRLH